MLSSPIVVGPASPCSEGVRVQGQLPGATVQVFATSPGGATRLVAEGKAASADDVIPLKPREHLKERDRLTAGQFTAADHGGPLPAAQGLEVLAEPEVADLNGLFSPESLLDCGTCLWVGGVVPGASVSLSISGAAPTSVDTSSDTVKFFLPAGERLHSTDSLEVSQTACGVAGNAVSLPAPLDQVRGDWPVDAPIIDEPIVECQRGIRLENVLPGATLRVNFRGGEYTACFGYRQGWFGLPAAVKVGDEITVRQEFPWCELRSKARSAMVTRSLPLPPAIIGPVCEGDRIVRIEGLFQGAFVDISADGKVLCRGAAPDSVTTFGVPSLVGVHELTATQSICDGRDGTWSDPSAPLPVRQLGPQAEPHIIEPLYEHGVAVGVVGVEKGSLVQVVAHKGVIGEGRGNGDERLDVPLWYELVRDDLIHLRTRRCGLENDWGKTAHVQPQHDVMAPVVSDPACDCGGSVHVHHVLPGTVTEVFLVRPGANHAYLGSARSGADTVSVDVPPLSAGDQLQARQRLGPTRSGLGLVATAPLTPHWAYVPNSAFRLCQLTQDWDPTGRPHAGATTPFGITGTDLGIPVDHGGRLYLFFGDCGEEGADPIGWLTTNDPDDLETMAPDMHWILGDDGQFRRLIVHDLPPLGIFEVPTGAFSYDGHIFIFVGNDRHDGKGPMTASHLAVGDDPHHDFQLLLDISSTTGGQILVLNPDGSVTPGPYPARRWMLHISATVVNNADWPGLPSNSGEGLLMFGSSVYRGDPASNLAPPEKVFSNVYLAWAPLTPDVVAPHAPIPHAEDWQFVTGFAVSGDPVWGSIRAGATPVPLLPADPWGPRLVGEISVVWYPSLRRWILAGSVPAPINVARNPWGPWTTSDTICDLNQVNPATGEHERDAGNSRPGGHWNDTNVVYAPYLIRRWFKWDRSTRKSTLYYTLSVYDEPNDQHRYQPQIMRSAISCLP